MTKVKIKSGKIINLRYNLMFYKHNIKCNYCHEWFDAKNKKCPNCGASKDTDHFEIIQ